MFTATEGVVFRVTDLAPGRDFYHRILQLAILSESESSIAFHIPDARITLVLDPAGSPPACSQPAGKQSPVISASGTASASPPEAAPARSALVLLVEDIDSAVHYLNRCGVRFVSPIEERCGLWICEIADPYGNAIAIGQLNEIRE